MTDNSAPISRVGYGPVYEGDDDIGDEHPRPDSPLSLLNITASTSLLPQQNSTTRSQSTGVTAATRRRLKWLKAKWRRGVFFHSIFGILGDDRDGSSNRESVGQFLDTPVNGIMESHRFCLYSYNSFTLCHFPSLLTTSLDSNGSNNYPTIREIC